MTFGFSRDDINTFLPDYLKQELLLRDPFQSLDTTGVGQLVEMGVKKGRSAKKDLKCGICGEHGGDPDSIKFCHKVGLDYVSLQPVPRADRPAGGGPSGAQAIGHRHRPQRRVTYSRIIAGRHVATNKIARPRWPGYLCCRCCSRAI